MDEEFETLLLAISELQTKQTTVKTLLSEKDQIRTWIKLEPFDSNFQLYYSINLILEDQHGNFVETSIDQIQLGKPLFENDLREKFILTKEELLDALTSF